MNEMEQLKIIHQIKNLEELHNNHHLQTNDLTYNLKSRSANYNALEQAFREVSDYLRVAENEFDSIRASNLNY